MLSPLVPDVPSEERPRPGRKVFGERDQNVPVLSMPFASIKEVLVAPKVPPAPALEDEPAPTSFELQRQGVASMLRESPEWVRVLVKALLCLEVPKAEPLLKGPQLSVV